MQTFTETHHFDQSADDVLKHFTDPDFLRRKYTALGRQDIEILEHQVDKKQARLQIRYSDKPDMEVPDFAKRLVPTRAVVLQKTKWDLQSRTGEVRVESAGAPMVVRCTLQLRDEGKACSNTLHWEVSCPVPLIGGKLEKALVAGLKLKSKRDEAESRKLLSVAD
ncbi:MAG TPA: DUF2505 domain-containing protein [Stenotrophobium sp.]|jgi:hypothetical protein|nr:DUF2505 domain-containing protein [Stenotrophobium sp.]